MTTALALGQQGIWVTEQTAEAGPAYHLPLLIRLTGPLDRDALLAACAAVLARHPLLSCGVRDARFVPGAAAVPVRLAAPGDSVAAEITRPFDLAAGPLARFTLFADGPDRHTLLAVAHHLVFDGRSKDVLVAELAAAYAGQPLGSAWLPAEPEDPEPALVAEAGEFWAGRWRDPGGLTVLGCPIDGRYLGPAREVRFTLAPDALRIVGFTRFEVLVAALHACLAGYGNTEVATEVDLSTRPRRQDPEPIGSYAGELPVFSRPAPELTFRALADGLRAELLRTYRYRAVPLSRALRRVRPQAPVSITYSVRREPEPRFAGLATEIDWMTFNHAVRGGLRLQCSQTPGGLLVSVRHHPALPGERFAAGLRELLDAVVADPDRTLADLVGPLTPAGPAVPAPAEVASTEPFSPELTEQVRVIWQEVLGVETVLDDDDLFDLGGHSLTITKIIARMRKQLRLDVSMDDFFDSPTIGGVLASATRAG